MKVNVAWDLENEVCVITYEDAKINSAAAYQEWQDKLLPQLDYILEKVGHKFPLVVGVDGLSFSKEFESKYGRELAPKVAHQYATAIARYGGDLKTRMVISSEAMHRILEMASVDALKKEYSSNIFSNRQDAIAFVLVITKKSKSE